MTKYHVVRDQLLDRLDGMAAGEQLPPERELAESLGVSRMTLRRAVDELVVAGQARRRTGAGVFAVGPKLSPALAATSFTEDMRGRGMTPGARVLTFDRRAAGARVGRRLAIAPSETVVHVARLRLADDEPMAIEVLYVPERLVPGLAERDLTDASFYEVLRERYDVVISAGVQTIGVTVTDEEESGQLDVPLHAPALLFERVSRDADGGVVEYVRSVYRGDRYQIRTELTPASGDATTAGESR